MSFIKSAPTKKSRALLDFWAAKFCLLGAFACTLLAGCFNSERRADLVIANGAEPESLDPAIIVGLSEMRIVSALFEGLTRLDPQTVEPKPSLADSWEI